MTPTDLPSNSSTRRMRGALISNYANERGAGCRRRADGQMGAQSCPPIASAGKQLAKLWPEPRRPGRARARRQARGTARPTARPTDRQPEGNVCVQYLGWTDSDCSPSISVIEFSKVTSRSPIPARPSVRLSVGAVACVRACARDCVPARQTAGNGKTSRSAHISPGIAHDAGNRKSPDKHHLPASFINHQQGIVT